MLSNTSGARRRGAVSRLNASERSNQLCPTQRNGGSCPIYQFECQLRRRILNEKEAELKKKAVALLSAEADALASGGISTAPPVPPSPSAVHEMLQHMKREREYEQWSLDLEVTRQMARLGRRQCKFAHHQIIAVSPTDNAQETANEIPADWAAAFSKLSVFQKLVVLLLVVRSVRVPLSLVTSDLRGSVARQMRLDEGDETLTDEMIAAEGSRLVTVVVHSVERGALNFPFLPRLLVFLVENVNHILGDDKTNTAQGLCYQGDTTDDVRRRMARSLLERATAAILPTKNGSTFASASDAASSSPLGRIPSSSDRRTPAAQLAVLHVPRRVSTKEFDLSSNARCQELCDALKLYWSWCPCLESTGTEIRPLRQLSLRGSELVSADSLVSNLRLHQLHTDLVGLDLSDNRLDSLRFLFHLRKEFGERLLFLGLANNPITKKPDYREQVRATLPSLVSLDGERIRRPPLALPFPTSAAPNVSDAQYADVCATVERFLYAWEAQQVPLPSRELSLARLHRARKVRGASTAASSSRKRLRADAADGEDDNRDESDGESMSEVEMDEDTFARVWLHPDCCFSLSVAAGCSWFDAEQMRVATDVEGDESFEGFRLSAQDVKELRVMDVSMRNQARNLLLGKTTVNRVARGQLNCFSCYQSTVYPARMTVRHFVDAAETHISVIGNEHHEALCAAVGQQPARNGGVSGDGATGKRSSRPTAPDPYRARSHSQQKPLCGPAAAPAVDASELFLGRTRERKPLTFLVTLHGTMVWRSPTMRDDESITAHYDRTLTLVHRVPPSTRLSRQELRKLPSLVVVNDQLSLRPPSDGACSQAVGGGDRRWGRDATFDARSRTVCERLAIEFGLDNDAAGQKLVELVVERSTSDASVYNTLETLVFGSAPLSAPPTSESSIPTVSQEPGEAPLVAGNDSLARRISFSIRSDLDAGDLLFAAREDEEQSESNYSAAESGTTDVRASAHRGRVIPLEELDSVLRRSEASFSSRFRRFAEEE